MQKFDFKLVKSNQRFIDTVFFTFFCSKYNGFL